MQFFYLSKLFFYFIFANYNHDVVAPTHTTVLSPVKTSFSSSLAVASFSPCNFSRNVANVENDSVGIGRQTNSECTLRLYKRAVISMGFAASIDSRDYWIAVIYLLRGEAGAVSGLRIVSFFAHKARTERARLNYRQFKQKKPSSDRSSRVLYSQIASSCCVNNQEDGVFCCVRRRFFPASTAESKRNAGQEEALRNLRSEWSKNWCCCCFSYEPPRFVHIG